ncbi:MAG: hypothetical protein RQ722_06315 [Desulfuromonadales bacterium]|nr:hypothetical protein [Desulfuromonadales bacterium]
MRIAIQPDSYGPDDTSSPLWSRLLKDAGHEVVEVDVYRADILDQLKGCKGFMWRHAHMPAMRQIARRLLPVLENELGMVVYPDQRTCWHYDDKIAQAYLFEALNIPTPKTWIWFDRIRALEFAETADYPLVLKLWAGAGSQNVSLVKSQDEARDWICRIFDRGVATLAGVSMNLKARIKEAAKILLRGEGSPPPWELHKNYVLFQEFLPDNAFDTRITVIGNRAFGFRRFNREGDFRASGSGKIDYDPDLISRDFLRLAFEAAQKLNTQSCAIDGLWRGSEAVVGEVSYTYASWAVHDCPGHWDADLNWHEGQMWPEEAHVEDFLIRLEQG